MSVKDLFDIDWDLYNRHREAQVRDHIRRENLKKAGIDPDAKKKFRSSSLQEDGYEEGASEDGYEEGTAYENAVS